MSQKSPIDTREPFIQLDFTSSTMTSQSLVFIFVQQFLDDTFASCSSGCVVGEGNLVSKDVGEGGVTIRAFERSRTVQHLVN